MSSRVIIAAPTYNPQNGGSIVLHKLCDILNQIGISSSLTTTVKLNGPANYFFLNPQFNTSIAKEFDPLKDIIIYPEIERGNPYEAKNVVRYILSQAHTVDLPEGSHSSTWGNNDFWLYFHELFYDGLAEKNILHIIQSKVDLYYDMGIERTIDSCYTYRKSSKTLNQHPPNSIEVQYNNTDAQLLQIFNKCKRFYSYDTETYLNVLAALCGCESIVIPKEGKTRDMIIHKQPSFKYGIAYGLNDIQHAQNTKHLVKSHLENLEQTQIQDTISVFNKVFDHFNL
jgi:hypothetical protein